MTDSPPRRRHAVKIRQGSPPTNLGRARTCPDHGSPLRYIPDTLRWECVIPTCEYREYPDPEPGENIPVVGTGAVELMVIYDSDGTFNTFLRATKNNVMINVTGMFNGIYGVSGKTGTYAIDMDHMTTYVMAAGDRGFILDDFTVRQASVTDRRKK